MTRHLTRRLSHAVAALAVLSLIVFLSAHATGDPARYLLSPEAATTADYEHLKRMLGLDKPLPEQFGLFLLNAARGDLGTSIVYHRPVVDIVLERLPATLQLALTAMMVSVALGVPLGVLAAVRRNSIIDRIVTAASVTGMAAPPFWIGIMLVTLFAGHLRWLPAFGRDAEASIILPAATLSLGLIAGIVRLTRSSMVEVLASDYVRFARLKGLSDARVIWVHALKNALIPVITFAGIMLGSLLNGSIVVEQVFGWPGVGRLTLEAMTHQDFPLLQGAVLFAGSFYIISSFGVDLAYAMVDPRLRYRADV